MPNDLAGRSMRPLLKAGEKTVKNWRDDYAFLHETCIAVRTHRHKLIHYTNVNERELYDLQKDPYEITNLIDNPAYASVLKDMERRLQRHIKETDFPNTRNHRLASPRLLGPFAAADEQAAIEAALAAPAGAKNVSVNGKDYSWTKPKNPKDIMMQEFKDARWMWMPEQRVPGKPSVLPNCPPGNVYFRGEFMVPKDAKVQSAKIQASVDNHYQLYVNGKKVARGSGWVHVTTHNITTLLKPGKNVIAFLGENAANVSNPAGLIAGLRVDLVEGEPVSLSSGKGWHVTDKQQAGWAEIDFDDSGWEFSQDLGKRDMAPWKLGSSRPANPAGTLGGKADELFLLAFEIEQLTKKDPFVRVGFNPTEKPVTGWVNGERLFNRRLNDNPFNRSFNPPLVKGVNKLIFKGRFGDYTALTVDVLGHDGKTRIIE